MFVSWLLPAGHEHSTVRLQVDLANHQGGIGQNVAVAEFIQVEQHVAGMAGELLHVAFGPGFLCTSHCGSSRHVHGAQSELEEKKRNMYLEQPKSVVWCLTKQRKLLCNVLPWRKGQNKYSGVSQTRVRWDQLPTRTYGWQENLLMSFRVSGET